MTNTDFEGGYTCTYFKSLTLCDYPIKNLAFSIEIIYAFNIAKL